MRVRMVASVVFVIESAYTYCRSEDNYALLLVEIEVHC